MRFQNYRVGLNNTYAKIGNLGNATVIPEDGVTRVAPTGSGPGAVP
ncbi:hypothetical protein [Frankia gtarii]|nr:hypothetical protein [Frankia gtarii]